MEKSEEKLINYLSSILKRILDAKEQKNITRSNKEAAIKDILLLLNQVYSKICTLKDEDATKVLNAYQNIFFKAITKVNKEVKYSFVKINGGLFRVYLCTIFKYKNQGDLLRQLTGWDCDNLKNEVLTEDMEIMILSIINLDENGENK